MLPFLLRLVNHFRPREGWPPLLLSLAALLCPPAAIVTDNKALSTQGLLTLTILAVIVGLRLARSRLTAKGATVAGGVLGSGLVVIVVGRLFPPPALVWTEVTYAVDWLRLWRQGVMSYPLPLADAAGFIWQRLTDLGVRLWWWSQTFADGSPAQDPIVFVLLASLLAWACGCFAVWQIYRRRAALVGLLPSGVAMTSISFFRGGASTFYLMTYLFCMLWLIAICHLWTRREHWHQTNTDYPGDLGLELVFALTPALILVLALATLFPVVHPSQVRDLFWKLLDGPWSAAERTSEQLFGPIQPGGAASGASGGSLPRAHLLGGKPELEETIVMYVSTNDPPPPRPGPDELAVVERQFPPRYWRGATYDTYTGQGWKNGPLEERTLPANQPLDPSLPPGFELIQHFEPVGSGASSLYAVNAPLRLDHTIQGWWRGPGDLAQASSPAERYTVVSRPPQPLTADLRKASPYLPPEMTERYQALPETVPQRVRDLAQEIIAGAETRYDQARALETYLRAYPYTLDLPEPPTDRDLVDYFLFDQQEGYCDYYASAMVVMARTVGIPARLAIGYTLGAYDYDEGHWVVVEKDGHSWAEVYFDAIGWVEFEPTAGRPALTRLGSKELPRPTVPPLPTRSLHGWQHVPWVLAVPGGVLVLLLAVIIWIWRPRQLGKVAASELIRERQARFLRWGARLGQPLRDGQTPREYSAELGRMLRDRGQDSRWSLVRTAGAEAPREAEQLTDAFVRTQYSATPPSDREGWQIRDLWIQLRRHLWWLWFGR
ncbi:MAG: DUF3488 and transglutaminase-like domain-containing protein [Anaerolineae bacterium]|jgi:transglutaminase-like putative cysteine protease